MLKKRRLIAGLFMSVLMFALIAGCAACDKKSPDDAGPAEPVAPVEPVKPVAPGKPEYTASVVYTGCGIKILPGKDRPVYTAQVRGVVVDDDTKEPIVSQLKIWDKSENLVYRTVTDYLGRYELILPDGNYDIEFSRGSEYEIETLRDYTVYTKGIFILPKICLKRLYTLDNWYAGDLHQHSSYSFDARDMPGEVLKSNIAMGCSWGCLSDHNSVDQVAEWMYGNRIYIGGDRHFIPLAGWEVTTKRGHYHAVNCAEIFNATASSPTDVIRIIKDIKSYPDTIAGINHPGIIGDCGFTDWNLAGRFDTLEIWNGTYAPPMLGGVNQKGYDKWIELMNKGIRLPVVGGTDCHNIYGTPYAPDGPEMDFVKRNTYSGVPRVYLHTEDYSAAGVLEAVKKGHSFITNGPLVFADINGVGYGDTVEPRDTLALNYDLKSCEYLVSLKIVLNGQIVKTIKIDPKTMTYAGTYELTGLKAGDWVQLQVAGDFGGYAITNPIMIGSYQG